MMKAVKKWGLTLLFLAFLGSVVLIFNDKINAYSDSLMVIITAVYVVATVEICRANIKSADATREQIEESKRQFEEENRAFVTVNLEIIRGGLATLHIHNYGKRVANKVRIEVSKSFIQNVQDQHDREHIQRLSNSIFTIGIGQSLYLCIGSHLQLEQMSKELLSIDISYSDGKSTYKEKTIIDLKQFFWALIYDSPEEDIYQQMKKVTKHLESIDRTLKRAETKMPACESEKENPDA